MASSVLYPPIVNSYAPAFPAQEDSICLLYFSLSKFNASTDFTSAHVVISKQDSGVNVVNKHLNNNDRFRNTGIILNVPVHKVESEDNLYYVEITNDDIADGWQIGWIYKIQLRLSTIDYDGTIGQTAWLNTFGNSFSEWSTICITKAIGENSITIPNYNLDSFQGAEADIIAEELNFTAVYNNTDTSEKLYSYRILLYQNEVLLEDSEILYSNKYIDHNQFSYIFKTEPINNTHYIIEIQYETINKYANKIILNCLIQYNELDITSIQLLTVENDINNIMTEQSSIYEECEEGRVALKLYTASEETNLTIMIRRSDSRDNFQTWSDIKKINISDDINSLPLVYDYTIESGVWYTYGVQKYEELEDKSVRRGPLNILPAAIMRDFNYTFLLGENEQQLKLQFDNTLNNFKINLNEGKVTTLGGQYPFISRVGATNYKTFTLGGLISFNMDENKLFLTKEQIYKFNEVKTLYDNYNLQNGINHYDYIYEREFRDNVIKFLHNGKPKLLKSPTEGNILIYLTDINLTPNQTLSRLIYSFTSNANEIGEAKIENYKKYKLLTV